MNVALWVVQVLLAVIFLFTGTMKLLKSKEGLKPKLGDWVDAVSSPLFKIIGLIEVLAAIGLILPMAMDIMPILTPIAAIGLVITMVGAILLHLKRGEKEDATMRNIPLMLLALFVVVGRLLLAPAVPF